MEITIATIGRLTKKRAMLLRLGRRLRGSLAGGGGNDTLRGGQDNDTVTGDAGDDIFVLAAGEGIDTVTDFEQAALFADSARVLIVRPTFPGNTLAEFIAYVKAQKEKMAYAEGTAGSVTHLAMALFAKRAGLDMTNVSYRGNAPAMNDVIAGHLKTMFSNLSDALPHAASGAIRLLAVSTAERSPQAPNVPTVAESGFPGFNVITWNGLAAPAGTPREIVDKIAVEIGRAVKDPKFAGRLKAVGADPLGNTPDEFAAMIKADTATWADAVAVTGLKAK